jgi:3-mercaptopyruvate sulfurtransferase SseA
MLAKEEEAFMERYLAGELQQEYTFVVYGRHTCDAAPYRKQAQLRSLGISRVYVYAGGLFEWLLLQDVYGSEAFPTRGGPPKDLLTFRPARQLA